MRSEALAPNGHQNRWSLSASGCLQPFDFGAPVTGGAVTGHCCLLPLSV